MLLFWRKAEYLVNFIFESELRRTRKNIYYHNYKYEEAKDCSFAVALRCQSLVCRHTGLNETDTEKKGEEGGGEREGRHHININL